MSSIEKLLIRGVRSFDPHNEEVVAFYTPLTLIVGHNGSGKTTIIECLKYITTGDLPPNSRGGAFINDPKVAGETEVRAQIKLKFRSVTGQEMVATRSLQLTQKKASVTFKTLESALVARNSDMEKISTSNRCLDLDTDIPQHLGVSRAILENVIFVHQEESNWPLSEPAILKKKFDEIFAATKYTKALQSIKDLRKEQAQELKLDTQKLEFLKLDKERFENVKTTLSDVEDKVARAKERITEMDGGEIATVMEQLKSTGDTLTNIGGLDVRINMKLVEKQSIEKQVTEISERIEELGDSDEELTRVLETYKEQDANLDGVKAQLDESKRTEERKLADLQTAATRMLTKKGKMQAESDAQAQKIADRAALVTSLSAQHGFRGFDHFPLSESDVAEFSDKLKASLREAENRVQQIRTKGRKDEEVVQQKMQELQKKITTFESERDGEKRQIAANKAKIDHLKRQLAASTLDNADFAEQESLLNTHKLELENAQEQMRKMDVDRTLRELGNQLAAKEHELKTVNEEITLANSLAETKARLSLKTLEKQRKSDSLKQQQDGCVRDFEAQFSRKSSGGSLESDVMGVIRAKQAELRTAATLLEESNRDLSQWETKMTMSKSQLGKAEAEFAKKSQILKHVLDDRDIDHFDQALADQEKEVLELKEGIASFDSMVKLYDKFLNRMVKSHTCFTCSRKFRDDQEEETILKLVQKTRDSFPVAKVEQEQNLKEREPLLLKMRELIATKEEAIKLRDEEIPRTRQELNINEKRKNDAVALVEERQSKMAKLKAEEEQAQNLKRRTEDVGRLIKELRVLEEDVVKLNAELASSGSAATMEELREKQSEVQNACDRLRNQIKETNQNARVKQQDIQHKSELVRDATDRLQALRNQRAEHERQQKEVYALQEDTSSREGSIRSLEEKIEDLEPGKLDLENELGQLRSRTNQLEQEASKEASKLKDSFNRMETYDREIERFINEGIAEKLVRLDSDLKRNEADVAQVQLKLQHVAEEATRLDKRASEQAVERRNVEDNLRLRKLQKDLVSTSREYEQLKKERERLDKSTLAEQFSKLKKKHEALVEERAHIMGGLKQLEEQERQLNKQLSTSYKNIEKQWSEHLIALKTKEMAHIDLEKYAKALDAAIMKYHSMKMDEINKIIKELWQKTYKGNDIQTIEIRADAESAKGNRSYNYRVVMVKDTTELDMRGRCSAGQKVLTSLIIRLALAETFCINSGILALDEPTTNLDHENMMSLAQSLSDIVEDRKKQANFQLIVITHDEDFMRALGASNHADHFFRIEKDDEGHPHIKRKPITSR